jgi:succinylglutamate desuccinylase
MANSRIPGSFLIIANMEDRIIGRYVGKHPGPLLICLGGIHGNEPAGIRAIEEVFGLLAHEKEVHPDFSFHGTLLGVRGNLPAIDCGKRFIHRDLNRILLKEELDQLRALPPDQRGEDEQEALTLVDLIEYEHNQHGAGITLLLDLHTTTAFGGIFSIAAEDEMSLKLAKGLFVPVILGIADTLKGTTIDYFNRPEGQLYSVVFEAGQHEDPESVSRTVSAIINCMRSIGQIAAAHVDSRHDGLLQGQAAGLPAVTRLVYHYTIEPGEAFTMRPGYKNFDVISKGETLASNATGIIASPMDGLILMPKYQPMGNDGFFIVQEENR